MRLGLRLARRELRRRPARAALVVLMVLIPTAAMTVVTTFLRTSELSPAAERRAAYGTADFVAIPIAPDGRSVGATDAGIDALRAGLGNGARVVVERSLYDRVRQGDRRIYLSVSELDLADPVLEGRFGRLSGRPPANREETVLTRSAARKLGVGIGDRFTPDRLGRSLEVVGLVRPLASNADTAYVAGPLPEREDVGASVFVDYAGPAPQVTGWQITPVETAARGRDRDDAVFWSYVGGGMGLLVLGTVVAAAFAIGARRQLRTVGLLSSSGASPRALAWFLVAQGATAGAVGSLLGVAAGLALTRATPQPLLESLIGRPVDGTVFPLLDLPPVLVIGTGAAMLAAWLPARSAARIPTLQALAGRRPLPAVPRRLPLLGVAAIAAGCVLFAIAVAGGRDEQGSSLWAAVAVAGAVALLAGTLALAPWVVAGMERVCARLSQQWRLAGRSLARSRVRSSAVVAAICAVAATVVGASTIYRSLVAPREDACCERDLPYLRANQALLTTEILREGSGPLGGVTAEPAEASPAVLARVERIVPGARRARLTRLMSPAGYPVQVGAPQGGPAELYLSAPQIGPVLATPAVLDLFAVPDGLRRRVERGQAIGTGGLAPGVVELQLVYGGDEQAVPPTTVPLTLGASFESPAASRSLPSVLMGADLAARLGLVARPGAVVIAGPSEFTDRQRRALELLGQDLAWETALTTGSPDGSPQARLETSFRDTSLSADVARGVLLALSLVLVLAVVAVGLALAANDSDDERQILAATGAPPRVLRQVGTRRAALLVLAAGAIAVPAGLLPAAAIVAASADRSEGFHLDPWSLAFVVVALPVVVGACTALGALLRDTARPARPDVFALVE